MNTQTNTQTNAQANALAKKLPQVWDDPERLISMKADHILFGPEDGFKSGHFL